MPEPNGPATTVRTGAGRKLAAWLGDYSWVLQRQFSGLLLLPRRKRVPEPYARGERAPVVLLPGVYETWQFLRPVADRLNQCGHPVHVIPTLGYNRLTIPQSAALVSDFLVTHKLQNVIIVAHSKGGLIGKYLMTMEDSSFRIDHLVAVNSPFHGSKYARYVPLRSVRAFVPSEPVLAKLGNHIERNSSITSIYSMFDPHIPAGSAVVGAQNVPLPLMGHFRILSHPALIDAVEAAVDQRT